MRNSTIAGKLLPGFKKVLLNFQTRDRNAATSHFYFDMYREAYGQEAGWLFYTPYSHQFVSAGSLQLQHTRI